jgi:CRISPR-associated protein (TIGR02584 family)
MRHVIVAVAGQTPAVITETLWVLEQQRRIPIDEIRVITTSQGREAIKARLLGEDGAFHAYCRDYGIAHGRIAFSETTIHVLEDFDGRRLEDIRTTRDNREAADRIFSLMREWTRRNDETLYCSLAGGRKTLGVYLAMSLMLCGRLRDTLSHVLVSSELEANIRDFYYPAPQARRSPGSGRRKAGDGTAGRDPGSPSPEATQVELADVPFPRLRELMGGELPLEGGLIEAIRRSELLLAYLQSPPPLTLRLDLCRIQLGDFTLRLSRQLTAVYAFFLLRFNGAAEGYGIEELFAHRDLIAGLERAIDRFKQGEQERYAWEIMKDPEDFRARLGPCISKINAALGSALGRNRLAQRYRIGTGGRYGVAVDRFQVLVTDGRPWESDG